MGYKLLLDSGLHVADDTEAQAVRDVDDAATLVTAEGRWAATWAGNLDAARAASASGESGLVMLCHSLLLEASRRLSPISSSSFCTADSERNRKGAWFYLKAACHPLPNSAAGEMASGRRPYERRDLSIPAPSNEHNA